MFNLLPEKYKKILRREYTLRLLVVVSALATIVMTTASVSLLPSYLLSKRKVQDLAGFQIGATPAPISAKETSDLQAILKKSKNDIALLQKPDTYSFVTILNKVSARQVPGITPLGFDVSDNGASQKVIISGIARGREDATAFKKSLETGFVSSSVDMPLSDLAKSKDFPFTMTVNAQF